VTSFILIHPTVWPQYTNITERQTENGPITSGEPFYKWSPQKRRLPVITLLTTLFHTVLTQVITAKSYPSSASSILPHDSSSCPSRIPLPISSSTLLTLSMAKIHRESKKGATLTMAITLSILDRFAKFFYCCK